MRSFNLDPAKLMTEVYSYPFPEVRQLLGSMHVEERLMLNTLSVAEAQELMAPLSFEPALELVGRADGTLDLDEIHGPVQDRIQAVLVKQLPGLGGFAHRYPVAGSSSAIFHLLAEWRATGRLETVAVQVGEYDGYSALAESLRIPVRTYNSLAEARPRSGEVWFVSNPSARDGNWISAEQWHSFIASGCLAVFDAAYVGLTADSTPVDVSAPNVLAVLTSPSKIFGVFRHRLTGSTFVREPIASLYGNKWFKDVPALLQTLALYERFVDNWLPKKYQAWQHEISRQLGDYVGGEVVPSDTILLASTAEALAPEFASFARGDIHRFGLTKVLEDFERQTT